MRIVMEVIPHKNQRYKSCGDWQFVQPDTLRIYVSETGNRNFNALLAIHEICEAILCKANGVDGKSVDVFDIQFEASRTADNTDEPGDDPKAPYKHEHCIATGIERIMAAELGVDWKTYEETLDAL